MGKIIAITNEEKEQIKYYHSKEYNDRAIMEATGLSYNKVYYIRHIVLKLPPYNNRKTVAKNGELILTYFRQGIPIKRISTLLNIGVWSIREYLRKKGLVRLHSKITTTKHIGKRELSIIIGTLLGDATLYINKSSKNNNAALIIRHSLKQKIYTEYLYSCLKPLNPRIKLVKIPGHTLNGRQIKNSYQIELKTTVFKELTVLKKQFYPKGVKDINFDLLSTYYNAEALAIHFMDDGSKCVDNKGKINGFILSTQCFTFESVTKFSYFILGRFGLHSTILKQNKGYIVRISSKSVNRFISIVKPYITTDLLYKISSSKTPLNRETPELDNPVLNPQETEENAKRLEVMPSK